MTTGTELGRPIEILLVEDNPGDVDLTREGLADGKLRNHLHVAGDGEEAMAFLRREEEHADMPMPDLILLDLNLPRKDGRRISCGATGCTPTATSPSRSGSASSSRSSSPSRNSGSRSSPFPRPE